MISHFLNTFATVRGANGIRPIAEVPEGVIQYLVFSASFSAFWRLR